MMRKTSVLLLLSVLASPVLASNEYQQWLMEQQRGVTRQVQAFQAYKDARDREFTAFLKAQWQAIDVLKGDRLDQTPKPVVMPVAPPVISQDKPQVVPPTSKPVPRPVPDPLPNPLPDPLPDPAAGTKPQAVTARPVPAVPVPAIPASPRGRETVVDFYGQQVRFYYDEGLRRRVPGSLNKDVISDHWSALSQADYEPLLEQLSQQAQSLQLNDWAFATLVDRLSLKITAGRENDTALLSWFLLAKSGYRARVAYRSNRVYLLLASEQPLFEVSYFTFSDRRYYAVDFSGNRLKPGQVYTYEGDYPRAEQQLDMHVSANVASASQLQQRRLSFEFQGSKHEVDVSYDRGRIGFFSQYPQLDLDLYFSSAVYDETASPLLSQLAAEIQGMDELTAVNFLLRFVQTSFEYATDEQQFGEENYLFPEETLFYPYSDCEDRAVLFAWLVTRLLELDVVGLDYPGHVAAAVAFRGKVAGDAYEHAGKRYVVTDPTYINATAGMTMPDFKAYTPRIISYKAEPS